jgi:hypothetical protein
MFHTFEITEKTANNKIRIIMKKSLLIAIAAITFEKL